MQDFAVALRAAREPLSYDGAMSVGEREGGFESYLVQSASRQAFELGHEAGMKVAGDRFRTQLEAVREQARLDGFDKGARVLLALTLNGLQEVVGELSSRRAHKVMLERARAQLGALVAQLEGAAAVMPTVHPELTGWPDVDDKAVS